MTKILETIKKYIDNQAIAYLSSESLDVVFETKVVESDEKSLTLLNSIPYDYINNFMLGTTFSLQIGEHTLNTPQLSTDGKNIKFPISDSQEYENTRQAARYPFVETEHVVCEFINPIDKKTTIKRQVLDLSDTGVSLKCEHSSKLFSISQSIPKLSIKIDGQTYKECAGTIMYSRKLMSLQGGIQIQVGIRFD